jgi:hypothetical protein
VVQSAAINAKQDESTIKLH